MKPGLKMTGPRSRAGADSGLGVFESNDSRTLPGNGGIWGPSSLLNTLESNDSRVFPWDALGGPLGVLATVGVRLRPRPGAADGWGRPSLPLLGRSPVSIGVEREGDAMAREARKGAALRYHESETNALFHLEPCQMCMPLSRSLPRRT